jgi:hypothetical protein
MLGGDLIRAQAHTLMPDYDVLYGNAMSGYPRLAALPALAMTGITNGAFCDEQVWRVCMCDSR